MNRSSKSKTKKRSKNTKQPVYIDIDDVVLNSAQTAINIINEKYRKPQGLPAKSLSDLKDWSMKSIYRGLNCRQCIEIFNCPEFWKQVTVKNEFLSLISSGILEKYEVNFVTVADSENYIQKQKFFQKYLPQVDISDEHFIVVPHGCDKSIIDMTDGIQIDDNFDNLIHTNARLKILLTNGLQTNYNNSYNSYDNNKDILLDNLYYINDLSEFQQILEFNLIEKL